MQDKKRIETIAELAIIVFLFVSVSFFFQLYGNEILKFAGAEYSISKMLYVIVTISAVVVAPVSTLPLISVATNMWGWVIAGTLSIVGWSIGAQLAFIIARRLGKPFVERFFSLKRLQDIENRFSNRNTFWTIVFLRMIIPVDILSYALGLFSGVRSITFFFATLLGISPFAYIFAYAGGLPTYLQLLVITEVVAVVGIFLIIHNMFTKRKSNTLSRDK